MFLFCHLKLAERISENDISMFERGTKISATQRGIKKMKDMKK